MGHSFSGELEVQRRVSKFPTKCIQSPLLLLCTLKALHIIYFQERLGNRSILRSQIIMGNVRKQTSENVPVSLLRSVDLPTDGKPTNPTRESPLLVTSNPSPAPPPLEDGGAKISRRNFANLAYTKTNRKFNASVEVKDLTSNYQAPDHFTDY